MNAERADGSGEGYRPEDFARGSVSRVIVSEDDEGGVGTFPDKHPTPTLRVFTGTFVDGKSKIDYRPWLLYHGFLGGEQGDGTWFEVYYRGVLQHEGRPVIGVWRLRVEGEGLESVCRQIGRQVATVLKPGKSEDGKVTIRLVTLEPMKVGRLAGGDEDEEE